MMRAVKCAAVAVITLLAGCASMPLPGGAGGGGYQVTIEFADVSDLVTHAAVKVDDVTVGQVEAISLTDDWVAEVVVSIEPDVELPDNAIAALRQTSLLGEKFVDIAPPTGDTVATGRLGDGDVIDLARTDRGAEVEEVLGAMALVLAGGGLEQLRTINTELVALMSGREDELSDTLSELETFLASLDEQRDNIVTALEALEQLSDSLADQTDSIGEAIDAIAPGVTVLAEQKDLISDGVIALGELGDIGTEVIAATKDDTLAMLRSLQPVLEQLAAAGDHFPQGLELAVTYPFPYNVSETIHDDFVNLEITLDLNVVEILGNLAGGKPVEQVDEDNPQSSEGPELGDAIDPIIGGLSDLLGIGLGQGGEDLWPSCVFRSVSSHSSHCWASRSSACATWAGSTVHTPSTSKRRPPTVPTPTPRSPTGESRSARSATCP